MSLERIVRPFQNGDVFTARRALPAVDRRAFKEPETAVVTWGGENAGQYETAPEPWCMGFDVKMEEDKSQRKTTSHRIENPDDPDQYIMVDRLKSAVFRDEQTGEKFNLQFADWDKDRK